MAMKFLRGQAPPPHGQQRPPQPKWSQGPLERVPCPHCGKPNDFRELANQQLIDTGHKMICQGSDGQSGCGRSMEVTAIRNITVVAVRKHEPTSSSAGRALTMSPAQLQRFLKG